MDTITIYKREYTLPVLADYEFQQIQDSIRTRHETIKEGKRAVQEQVPVQSAPKRDVPKSGGFLAKLFGSKSTKRDTSSSQSRRIEMKMQTRYQSLNFEQRFEETQKLIQDYEAMLHMLRSHKASYDRLLAQISDDIRQLVTERSRKILQAEAKRAELEAKASQFDDDETLAWTQSQEEQLVRSVRLVGQSAILIVKKLRLFQQGLARFTEDQAVQRQVLDSVAGRLHLRYEAYQLQKDINAIEQEAAELAKVAVNFEELMQECFGPFQQVIEEVITIDSTFAGAIQEIKGLTDIIQREQNGSMPLAGPEDELLNFLVHSHVKRERLADVLEQARWEDASDELFDMDMRETGQRETSVELALENICTLIDIRLPESEPDIEIVEPRKSVATVGDTLIDPVTGMEFVWIPPGRFWMGATEEDQKRKLAYDHELPRHEVEITQGFWLGTYPVTQAQWLAVMGKNPSHFNKEKAGGDWERHPVEQVSWDDCQEFLSRLRSITAQSSNDAGRSSSAVERASSGVERASSGVEMRLPTEAEWEYACRARTQTIWYFGNDEARLADHAWYRKNAGGTTHPVGQREPNAWGLHDMHGNVWEWCQDIFDSAAYSRHARQNPCVTGGGSNRVSRGGSWGNGARSVRSANRNGDSPGYRDGGLGFRLLRTE